MRFTVPFKVQLALRGSSSHKRDLEKTPKVTGPTERTGSFLKERTRSGIINWMLFMAPTGEQQEGALHGLGHGVVGNQTESECFVTFSIFTERLHHGEFILNK